MKKMKVSEVIVIKKYANRRLYDTAHSRYVNLKDIFELIRQGQKIEVVDVSTGEDATKVILTQIIAEEEKGNRNLLPTEFLHQIIQFGEQAYGELADKLLSAAIAAYRTAQEQSQSAFLEWLKPWTQPLGPAPAGEVERLKAKVAELEARLQQRSQERPAGPSS
jgi:polyhydroxyalkanoate synthesis repressor PhaR